MLHGYKKKRYQLFDNLDYLGFNLYEQRHFCFGDEGDGPGSEGGFAEDYANSINAAVAAAAGRSDAGPGGPMDQAGRDAASANAEEEAASIADRTRAAREEMTNLSRMLGLTPDPNITTQNLNEDPFDEDPFDYTDIRGLERSAAKSKASQEDTVAALTAAIAGAQTTAQKEEEALSLALAELAAMKEATKDQSAVMELLSGRTAEERAEEERSFEALTSTWAGAQDRLTTLNAMKNRGLYDEKIGLDLNKMSATRDRDIMEAFKSMNPKQKEAYANIVETWTGKEGFGPAEGFYDIPFMNFVRDEMGKKSRATGYRGKYEARSANAPLSEEQYDPNTLTGAGTGERDYNMSMFQSLALQNPNLTAEEALSLHNEETPGLALSMADVQAMGFTPNNTVGPVADFRETQAEKGLYQGLGLLGKFATGGPASMFAELFADPKRGLGGTFVDMFVPNTIVEAFQSISDAIPSAPELPDVFGRDLPENREPSTYSTGSLGPSPSFSAGDLTTSSFPMDSDPTPPPTESRTQPEPPPDVGFVGLSDIINNTTTTTTTDNIPRAVGSDTLLASLENIYGDRTSELFPYLDQTRFV